MKSCRKSAHFLICIVLVVAVAGTAYAADIESGIWLQTSSTAGDCADCSIEVTLLTPHVIGIDASNGWMGFAYYVSDQDEYRGFMELKPFSEGSPDDWLNKVFTIRLVLEKMTLNLEGSTTGIEFAATFRKE